MRVLQPSWGLSLKVWWAMTWRIVLLAVIVGFMVGIAVSIYGKATHMTTEEITGIANLLGALVGIGISVLIIRRMMEKGFGSLRLVVVDRYDT